MVRRTTPLRRAAALLTIALAAPLGAVTLSVTAAGPAAAAPLHTLVNPTFDGTTGWFESTTRGALTNGPGRRGTGARLTHTATSRYPVILNDTRNTVSRTVAGASYTATAWVRASVATPVTIRLQEVGDDQAGRGRLHSHRRHRVDPDRRQLRCHHRRGEPGPERAGSGPACCRRGGRRRRQLPLPHTFLG